MISAGVNLTGMTSPIRISRTDDGYSLRIRRNICRDEKWVPLDGSEIELPYFSLIIRAIGSRSDVKPDTCPENLIYAGDCKTGGSTIVEAIASGRAAAAAFIQ